MRKNKLVLILSLLLFCTTMQHSFARSKKDTLTYVTYVVDAQKQNIDFYWKNDKDEVISTIKNLKKFVSSKKQKLIFATNGGMFDADYSSHGLYIEQFKTIKAIDTTSANYGNFYLKPNGVFYITKDNKPFVCKTADFIDNGEIKYATQSGPMLLIDGEIHQAFTKGSKNVYVRNGVGILPDGNMVFVISLVEVNLYDFASYFKSLGCQNALYLDGHRSQMYLPKEGIKQTDEKFGVIIGVTEKK